MRNVSALTLILVMFVACNGGAPATSAASASPTAAAAAPAQAAPVSQAAPAAVESPGPAPDVSSKGAPPRQPPQTAEQLAATIMDPRNFASADIAEVYANARFVADRLDKMYCYCHCHEHMAHRSLLTCFQGEHAAECGVCLREGYEAFADWKEGKPVQTTQKTADAIYNGGMPPPSLPQ